MAEYKIFLVLSLMLVFAIAGYLISRKIKQPASVGIIVLGILLGPSVLGVAEYDGTIAIIAQLGSIILLFVAGLNSNVNELFNKKTFYVALFGSIVPLILGYILSIIFGYPIYTSIFIGATLTATCLGITSSVLKEIGKIKTETAKIMIGAAVIDDIISLTILSIILSIPENISALKVASKIGVVLLFVTLMLLFGYLLGKIVDYFDKKISLHSPRLSFVLALSLVFFFSYLAQHLGLAAIVGAFMTGLGLSRSRVLNLLLAGSEYFEIIFTSIFFISIGIIVEISAFYNMFWFIIALTIIAILSKMIGSGIPAYKLGMKKKDALIVGTGMSPRGEVAFIVALNGFMLGVISKEVYSAIVFMSFLTTIITLIMLKQLYKNIKSSSSEEVDFIEMKIRR
jgi:Kef-type K+ transport system membrane component KefB